MFLYIFTEYILNKTKYKFGIYWFPIFTTPLVSDLGMDRGLNRPKKNI